MIGCLWTRVRKQPINVLYFEFETVSRGLCSNNTSDDAGKRQIMSKRASTFSSHFSTIIQPR